MATRKKTNKHIPNAPTKNEVVVGFCHKCNSNQPVIHTYILGPKKSRWTWNCKVCKEIITGQIGLL